MPDPTSPAPPSRRPGSSLLIRALLERVRTWAPHETITYRHQDPLTYAQWLPRVGRLGHLLESLGVEPGERVGVLDWDSHRYLDHYFAVPMHGAALHTVNVRLTAEQIAWTIHHARDVVLFVHAEFLPLVQAMRDRLPHVRRVVLMSDTPVEGGLPPGVDAEYEAALAAAEERSEWLDFSEDTTATVFYTTGTTGEPKGVHFSHREIVLHTLTAGLQLSIFDEPFALRASDVYLPLTPMFHVHAWGLPYLATMLGMRQVYPGKYEPAVLLELLERHKATFSHCVPTILQMLLRHPASASVDWSRLKLVIGGAALTPAMVREAHQRGIRIYGGYGMSETCPIVAVSQIKPHEVGLDEDARLDRVTRTGFPLPLVQAAVLDPDGRTLPPGSQHAGELVLRSPWLTHGYLDNPEATDALWRDGWLHTGDIAYRDNDGYLRITDRLKDVVKIGGEWISSLEIEACLARHPAVLEVAVVAVPDAKWGERPHAEIVLKPSEAANASPRDLQKHLSAAIDAGSLHQRAILTQVVWAEALPRTSVGKIDKKTIRARLARS